MMASSKTKQSKTLWQLICNWYLLYELNTSVYMLDFKTKCVVNFFMFMFVAIVSYSTFVYLPQYIFTMLAFFNIISSRADPTMEPIVNVNS